MVLRFIGTDGSMGLQKGREYEVHINVERTVIWLEIYMGWFRKTYCPYETLNALAKNWELPGRQTSLR